jgi:two-component system nitrogen regulation response regulator NtrX
VFHLVALLSLNVLCTLALRTWWASIENLVEQDIFSINDTLSITLKEARESFEKEYLTTQLKKFSGNISKTAKFVGMERSALHRKLKLLGVKDLN